MKINILYLIFLVIISCSSQEKTNQWNLGSIEVKQLTPNTFQHISYLQTEDFGKVAYNGLIVIDGNEALIMDTPVSNFASTQLISWIEKERNCQITGIVATHFHEDCIAGLDAFHEKDIPSYAHDLTLSLINQSEHPLPKIGFQKATQLKVGNAFVQLLFLGQGHTRDNIVGYFQKEKVLFGGCLVKSLNASKGFVGDANIAAWPKTVKKVKLAFPEVEVVVPGHGNVGGTPLLDYTIALFSEH